MSNKKLGLIVNPIAGIGGRVGLKGSDGIDVQNQAILLGARSESSNRTLEALRMIQKMQEPIEIITYPGEMGENTSRISGLHVRVIGTIESGKTTASDTIRAAKDLLSEGVD